MEVYQRAGELVVRRLSVEYWHDRPNAAGGDDISVRLRFGLSVDDCFARPQEDHVRSGLGIIWSSNRPMSKAST